MKVFLFMIMAVMANNHLLAQKGGAPPLTHIEVKHNGISHSVMVGDKIHLGFGAEIDGTFRFIHTGGSTGLRPVFANKSGVVTKLKYSKLMDHYIIYIKGSFSSFVVDVVQAVGIGEVIGFNDTYFRVP